MKKFRIMTRCNGGHNCYWEETFEADTRWQCQQLIKARARNGMYTATMTITSRTANDFRRLNPT
jgi:hypothetical protein